MFYGALHIGDPRHAVNSITHEFKSLSSRDCVRLISAALLCYRNRQSAHQWGNCLQEKIRSNAKLQTFRLTSSRDEYRLAATENLQTFILRRLIKLLPPKRSQARRNLIDTEIDNLVDKSRLLEGRVTTTWGRCPHRKLQSDCHRQ